MAITLTVAEAHQVPMNIAVAFGRRQLEMSGGQSLQLEALMKRWVGRGNDCECLRP
jgi:hypothetical protein